MDGPGPWLSWPGLWVLMHTGGAAVSLQSLQEASTGKKSINKYIISDSSECIVEGKKPQG